MTIGNLGALMQTNVKRLLAYSSIAHAGYVLVAFAAARTPASRQRLLHRVLRHHECRRICRSLPRWRASENYAPSKTSRGLGPPSPLIAALFAFFLLSLIGIPFTGGFFGKFYVFSAALQAGHVWLAVIGVINSAIAAYYYLRVIVYMYMRDQRVEAPAARMPFALGTAVANQRGCNHLPGRAPESRARQRITGSAGPREVTRKQFVSKEQRPVRRQGV